MSHSKTKLSVKVSKTVAIQCRDRAKAEGISVRTLLKQAIAHYLTTPTSPPESPMVPTTISTADYARLLARIERLEAQLTQQAIAPSVAVAITSTAVTRLPTEDEDWDDGDEPDEILYDFLEPPRSMP